MKQYDLVVLIRFREKKAQEACCLEDLLPYDATTNMQEILTVVGEGEGMLIVCDGFDELPHNQRQEGSVYIDLLKGRLLPEATIIVTSCPSVSADLWRLCQHNIHRHLEVIGFTKEDIKQFAESVFSGTILAEFLSYITSNPPIYGMMYIPLNAVIVALIYKDSYDTNTPFPTTTTQLFDALTRALIRRQLVSTSQVSNDYCMPPFLQCSKHINELPSLVAQQLLQLAKVAFETLDKEKYVFTDLAEDFEHLGMMKKTTSLNVCTGPGCTYSFLHLTLQDYLTALYIAIVNPNNFKLEDCEADSVIVRFLAGICSHDDYPVYQELVRLLSHKSVVALQLVHCAYECPSIMHSVKVDYSERDMVTVRPVVGFDWYATGYCISRFDERWGLSLRDMERIDLLVKGIKSIPITKGRIRYLSIEYLSFPKVFSPLREFCQLYGLTLRKVSIHRDDEVILQQLIAPGSKLKRLVYHLGQTYTSTFIPLLFQESSVENLLLDISGNIIMKTDLLPEKNTNLKELTISWNLLHPLAMLILNISSLTYLAITNLLVDSDLPVLTNIVQSHHTLKILQIGWIVNPDASTDTSANLLQLIEAASSSQFEKLRLYKSNYENLPLHIRELYRHQLELF